VGLHAAGSQAFGRVPPAGAGDAGHGPGADVGRLLGAREAAPAPDVGGQAGVAQGPGVGVDGGAAGGEIVEHPPPRGDVELDAEVGVGGGQGGGGPGEGDAVDRLAGEAGDLGGALVLEHLEARRDAGLEGEAAQQLFAEGVDGLDLQAAGGLQGAGEEAAGGGEVVVRGGDVAQPGAQFAIFHDRPFAQAVEQAPLHLGGRRLGVGDAEDGPRRGAAQQQAGDAVDQGGGLARAGVGGEEDRGARVGGGAGG
jgi:hypothetical protein